MILLARTTPLVEGMKKTQGLSVLLVDMREAIGNGLTIRPIRTMMNHATTEVFFDDLRVPVENLIGDEGKGFSYILTGMNAERILIASECIGDAKWFIDKAVHYAKEPQRIWPNDRAKPRDPISNCKGLCQHAVCRVDGQRGSDTLRIWTKSRC